MIDSEMLSPQAMAPPFKTNRFQIREEKSQEEFLYYVLQQIRYLIKINTIINRKICFARKKGGRGSHKQKKGNNKIN